MSRCFSEPPKPSELPKPPWRAIEGGNPLKLNLPLPTSWEKACRCFLGGPLRTVVGCIGLGVWPAWKWPWGGHNQHGRSEELNTVYLRRARVLYFGHFLGDSRETWQCKPSVCWIANQLSGSSGPKCRKSLENVSLGLRPRDPRKVSEECQELSEIHSPDTFRRLSGDFPDCSQDFLETCRGGLERHFRDFFGIFGPEEPERPL